MATRSDRGTPWGREPPDPGPAPDAAYYRRMYPSTRGAQAAYHNALQRWTERKRAQDAWTEDKREGQQEYQSLLRRKRGQRMGSRGGSEYIGGRGPTDAELAATPPFELARLARIDPLVQARLADAPEHVKAAVAKLDPQVMAQAAQAASLERGRFSAVKRGPSYRGALRTLRGRHRARMPKFDSVLRKFMRGTVRFSEREADQYKALEEQYFKPGGFIEHLRGAFGQVTAAPGSTTSTTSSLAPSFAPRDLANLRTTYGRQMDLADAYDPDRMAAQGALEARNQAEAALQGNLGRMTAGQAARAGRDAALTGAAGGALGSVAGRDVALRGRAGALADASRTAATTAQTLLQQRQQTLTGANAIANAWASALGNWGSAVGQRLGIDANVQGNATSAYQTWLGQAAQTARQNAATEAALFTTLTGRQHEASMQDARERNVMERFNVGAANQRSMWDADRADTMSRFNVGESNLRARDAAARADAMERFNVGGLNTRNMWDVDRRDLMERFNVGAANERAVFDATRADEMERFNVGGRNRFNMWDVDRRDAFSRWDAGRRDAWNMWDTDARNRDRWLGINRRDRNRMFDIGLDREDLDDEAGLYTGGFLPPRRGRRRGQRTNPYGY